jgi:hypothetical protein
MNHLLRAQPPHVTLTAAQEADALLRGTLQVATSEVPPGSFRESLIHLRVKCGGLGILSAVDAAWPAYFASWAACGAAITTRCPHLAADIIAAVFATPPHVSPAAPPLSDNAEPAPPALPPTLPFQRDLQDL